MSRRHYNGETAERININNRYDMPFAEGFPRRSNGKECFPGKLPTQFFSPHPADAKGWPFLQVKDVEESKRDSSQRTIEKGAATSLSYMDVEGTGEALLSVTDTAQRSVQSPLRHMKEIQPDIDHFNLDTTINNKGTPLDKPSKYTEQRMSEQQSALGSLPQSQETETHADERRKWVPYTEFDDAHEELRRVRSLSADTDLELDTELESRTIHVLGIGPTGKYIAHALAGLPDAPPVTLLMHRPFLMQQWHEEGAKIRLLRDGKVDTKSNINIESCAKFGKQNIGFIRLGKNLKHTTEQPDTMIHNLIVTTEGHTSVAALSTIRHRLRHSSTICFIQDGLGVLDLVNSSLFPDPELRPNYMLGNMTHDLLSTGEKFTLIEKRPGRTALTMAPRELSGRGTRGDSPLIRRMDHSWAPTSTWVLRNLSRSHELDVVGLAQPEFYTIQLQKLAINSVIGPLSVVYDCLNDELLCNYQVSRSMRLLLKEISRILQRLPELSRVAKVEKRFSAENLEKAVVGVLGKTGRNATAMLQAVRNGQRTDIDFYNGYLIKRAAELEISCPHLEMMVAMVKGKQAMKSRERNSSIPFKA